MARLCDCSRAFFHRRAKMRARRTLMSFRPDIPSRYPAGQSSVAWREALIGRQTREGQLRGIGGVWARCLDEHDARSESAEVGAEMHGAFEYQHASVRRLCSNVPEHRGVRRLLLAG